jgi:hypothetical protein
VRARERVASSTKLIGVLVAAMLAATMIVAPAVRADFHFMKIREVAGDSGGPSDTSYIELQMYAPGQNRVSGHSLTFWDQDAFQAGCGPCPIQILPITGANPANSDSQRTILIGDAAVPGRDFTLDLTPYLNGSSGNNLVAAGAVCWEVLDCVSWGGASFTGAANLPDGTTPFDGSLTQLLGTSGLNRNIGGGTCAMALDPADDTNNADADFSRGIGMGGTPNSATPPETPCVAPGTPTPTATPTTPAKKKKCKKRKKKSGGAPAYAAKQKKCKKKKRR